MPDRPEVVGKENAVRTAVVIGPAALAIRSIFFTLGAVSGYVCYRLIQHRAGCREVDGVVVNVTASAKGYTPTIEYRSPEGSSGRCEGMTTSRKSEIGDKITVLVDAKRHAKTLGSYQFGVWFAGIFAAVFVLLAFTGTVHVTR